MKPNAFLKKCLVFLFSLVVVGAFTAICVSAAGTDDGVISVITENSVKYFGTEKSDFCTEYVAANGNDGSFLRYENIDINGDGKSDICDLVSLDNKLMQSDGTDLDFNSTVDSKDLAIMRKTLIGITDILN